MAKALGHEQKKRTGKTAEVNSRKEAKKKKVEIKAGVKMSMEI